MITSDTLPRNGGDAAGSVRTRILVVDDHPLVRSGLVNVIENEPDLEVCGQAGTLAEGMRLLEQTRPHLVTIDISLPDGSGLEFVKDVRCRFPHVKLLVVSMHDEQLFAERALRAGASGYVDKYEANERLLTAIRHVLDGRVHLSAAMTDRMLCRSVGSERFSETPPIMSLSDRELEVFELIGRGVTTREIAERLDLSPKTIETYRENIKSKLNLENATKLTCRAVQWVLEENGTHAGALQRAD